MGGLPRGAAWLSSVRAVRCGLESPNERNPLNREGRDKRAQARDSSSHGWLELPPLNVIGQVVPAQAQRRQQQMRQKSSQYGLYRLGHTRATRAAPTGRAGDSQSDPPMAAPVRIARCKLRA